MNVFRNIALIFLTTGSIVSSRGQEAVDSELYTILKQKDSLLFRAAFDTCDPATMASLFSDDFEFYHDRVGPTDGKQRFLSPMYTRCQEKDGSWVQPSKRILIEGSLVVYPLRNNGELYGAIQEGRHRFEFLNENREYQQGDIARFLHLWLLEDGQWKIKRELSYDHQSAETYTINKP
ncbi:nuclear transport factor 2 family protein [Muriicola sp.]|uniref:nuclear transport factor 2 family protein n=1 Tax=Muriicola sp. TaxID=2020856 RepID=UPI003563A83D